MKRQKYEEVLGKVTLLCNGEEDHIAIMSTVSCEVFHAFEYINWVGFYRVVGAKTLKVGPYQGGHGCLEIAYDRGICGKCAREERVQLVEDVSKVDFHIACSSETKSEIVLPVISKDCKLIAVFDLDSVEKKSFDDIDVKYLTQLISIFE